jgi:hypothetical protein
MCCDADSLGNHAWRLHPSCTYQTAQRAVAQPLASRGRAGRRSPAVAVQAAMFDKLSRSMDKARKQLTGNDKLTAENMKVWMGRPPVQS